MLPHLLKSAESNPSALNPPAHPTIGTTGGRIVFISVTFHYTGIPLQAHVAAAKAGIDALSASVAIEYGPRGLTSNVIAPGGIAATEGIQRLSNSEDGSAEELVPLGRWGSLREIADATVYLFSDAANYVNGEVLVVDGGGWRTMLAGGRGGGGFRYPDSFLAGKSAKL